MTDSIIILERSGEASSTTGCEVGLASGGCEGLGLGAPLVPATTAGGCGGLGLGAPIVSATAGDLEVVTGDLEVVPGASVVAASAGKGKLVAFESDEDSEGAFSSERRASSSLKEFIMSDCVGIGGAPDCELVPHANAGSATAGDGELVSSANVGPVSAGAIGKRTSAPLNVFSATAGVSATAGDCWPSAFGNSMRCQSWYDASGGDISVGATSICSCAGAS